MGNSKSMVIQGLCSEIRGVQSLSRTGTTTHPF